MAVDTSGHDKRGPKAVTRARCTWCGPLNMLVGVIERWPDESRHRAIYDCKVFCPVRLGADDSVDESPSVGDKGSAWLQDEGQTQVHDCSPDLLHQIPRRWNLVAPGCHITASPSRGHPASYSQDGFKLLLSCWCLALTALAFCDQYSFSWL